MKIRTDFVTNSSSSSFILARKGELNEKQKAAIIEFVENKLLGEKWLSPTDSEEEIINTIEKTWEMEGYEEEIKQALAEGKTIYGDSVDFEQSDYHLEAIYRELWEIVEKNSDGDFTAIDYYLEY